MTIRHLNIFVAVADYGSMSAAATHLYLSQPTVSQAIRELEKFRQQGFTPEQVIRHSIANEYQGLFAPKSVRPETLLRQVNTVSFPDSAIPPGFRG